MKKNVKTRFEKRIQDLNDEDVVMMLCNDLSLGMSKPNYTWASILKQIKQNWIEKGTLINIYFEDVLNTCETKEEVDNYIKGIIKEIGEL